MKTPYIFSYELQWKEHSSVIQPMLSKHVQGPRSIPASPVGQVTLAYEYQLLDDNRVERLLPSCPSWRVFQKHLWLWMDCVNQEADWDGPLCLIQPDPAKLSSSMFTLYKDVRPVADAPLGDRGAVQEEPYLWSKITVVNDRSLSWTSIVSDSLGFSYPLLLCRSEFGTASQGSEQMTFDLEESILCWLLSSRCFPDAGVLA